MAAARLVNLAALAFTIAMAGFLLLAVDFHGLKDPCLHQNTCDISDVALHKKPLAHGSALGRMFKLSFLSIFSLYWLWSAAVSAVEVWCASPLSQL
jgi:Autophagy protein ATG9